MSESEGRSSAAPTLPVVGTLARPQRAVACRSGGAAAFSVVIMVGIALAVAYPNLPEISGLMDYRPKLPMRVFS
jgi:penicillin-binding protein 1A